MDFLPEKALGILLVAFSILSKPAIAENLAGSITIDRSCFEMEWKRGKPFDYYHPETRESTGTFRGGLLHLVEKYHFNDDVRNLVKGLSGAMPGDIHSRFWNER